LLNMTNITFHSLAPIYGLFVSITSQFIGLRTISKLNFYKSVFFGFGCGFVFLFGLEIYFNTLEQRPAVDYMVILFVNFFCFFMMQGCYFLFINTVVSALRVRFLDELSKFPKGLTLEEIISYYNPKEITQNRIDKLSSARQIYVKKNRYFIKRGPILLVAKIYDCMKLIVLRKKFQRVCKKISIQGQ
jgi:hypothetical protein